MPTPRADTTPSFQKGYTVAGITLHVFADAPCMRKATGRGHVVELSGARWSYNVRAGDGCLTHSQAAYLALGVRSKRVHAGEILVFCVTLYDMSCQTAFGNNRGPAKLVQYPVIDSNSTHVDVHQNTVLGSLLGSHKFKSRKYGPNASMPIF